MIRLILLPIAILLSCLNLTPNSLRADFITAEYVPGSFGSGNSVAGFNNGITYLPAQVFTATVAGELSKISVGVWSNSNVGLTVELRSVSSGLPTSNVLASSTINPGVAFAAGILHTADFSSSGVSLLANSQYAISLRTIIPGNNASWSGNSGNPYTGGSIATSSNNGANWTATSGDGVFRVTVTAVPEPSGCLLACFGVGALLMRRYRRTPG